MPAQTKLHRPRDEGGIDKRHELIRSAICPLAFRPMYQSRQHPPITPAIPADNISLGCKTCGNDDDGKTCFDPGGTSTAGPKSAEHDIERFNKDVS